MLARADRRFVTALVLAGCGGSSDYGKTVKQLTIPAYAQFSRAERAHYQRNARTVPPRRENRPGMSAILDASVSAVKRRRCPLVCVGNGWPREHGCRMQRSTSVGDRRRTSRNWARDRRGGDPA